MDVEHREASITTTPEIRQRQKGQKQEKVTVHTLSIPCHPLRNCQALPKCGTASLPGVLDGLVLGYMCGTGPWEGVGKQVGEREEMTFVERVVVSTTLGVVWS
jgi:hypothetical protein